MGKVSFGAYVDSEVLRQVDAKRGIPRTRLVEELFIGWLESQPPKPVEVPIPIPSYRELREQIFRNLRRAPVENEAE